MNTNMRKLKTGAYLRNIFSYSCWAFEQFDLSNVEKAQPVYFLLQPELLNMSEAILKSKDKHKACFFPEEGTYLIHVKGVTTGYTLSRVNASLADHYADTCGIEEVQEHYLACSVHAVNDQDAGIYPVLGMIPRVFRHGDHISWISDPNASKLDPEPLTLIQSLLMQIVIASEAMKRRPKFYTGDLQLRKTLASHKKLP